MSRQGTPSPVADLQSMQRAEHNRYQRQYYETRELPRMIPSGSPYVQRQLDRVADVAGLSKDARLLEVGSGLGRYTLPLLARGFAVTAVDLSPVLLEELRLKATRGDLKTVACDIADVAEYVGERFTQAVGFFTLHHMHDLDVVMRGLARVLAPGARVAFCEPNAYNPLFYAQILLTPGMTWRGDGGVAMMRPGVVLGALERADFSELGLERFGVFPPFLANTRLGGWLEQRIDAGLPLRWLRAFQVFHAVRGA